MPDNRPADVLRLCGEVLSREGAERVAYLDEACGADVALRREVEALLEQSSSGDSFLDTPPWVQATPALGVGQRLGPYQVTGSLGAGGMGEVYKARDTRLGRTVAIKVLPPVLAGDPHRRHRFEQEARAVSALNHPHICTLHDIGVEDGINYLVLEHCEGESLAERLARKGRLPVEQVLEYGAQIAEALAAAHRQGVVHRDLKPDNVMITKAGAKLLDFGLARLTQPTASAGATAAISTLGVVVGTVPYMAPEQVEGKATDARTDVWALGAVLYEMLTGRQAFEGTSPGSVMGAILEREPSPIAALQPLTPRALEHVVVTCLAKDPDARWQAAGDVGRELRWIGDQARSETTVAAAGDQTPRHRRSGVAVAAVLALAASGIAGWWWWSWNGEDAPPPHLVHVAAYPGRYVGLALSPDGKQLAFGWNGGDEISNWDIYVKRVGEVDAARLTRGLEVEAHPCWSPDGERIAFLRRGGDGRWAIFTMSSLGGDERKLAEVGQESPMSWSPDGLWLATRHGSAIALLPVAGGDPVQLTWPTAPAYDSRPRFSWDGRSLAFVRRSAFHLQDVFVQPLTREGKAEGPPRQITRLGTPIGNVAWHRDGSSLVVSGEPAFFLNYLYRVSLRDAAAPERIAMAGVGSGSVSTSRDSDRLAFVQGLVMHDIYRIATNGVPEAFVSSSLHEAGVDLSQDGSRVAFDSNRNGETMEVWTADANGGNQKQLTHGPGRNQHSPRWSPDGRLLAFVSLGPDGQSDIFTMESDGGQVRRLTHEPSEELCPAWSADGQWIYFQSDRGGKRHIWRTRLSGGPWEQVTSGGDEWIAREAFGGSVLYYTTPTSLMAKPLRGGPERRLIDSVSSIYFAVTDEGIYYWGRGNATTLTLMFFELASGKSTEVARVQAGDHYAMNMTASRDGKTVLYSSAPGPGRPNLMLIENFR